MARKYVRRDDGGVDLLTYHKRMTKAEFKDRKAGNKAAIKAIDDEIKEIKSAELPEDATDEQTVAIDEFNFGVDQKKESLEERRKILKTDEAQMDVV